MKRKTIFNCQFSIANLCRVFLLLVWGCAPIIAFASIGDELDSLLNQFFGSEKTEIRNPSPVLNIPDIHVPENPTLTDVADFKKQIQGEEESLAEFETGLIESQQKLWQAQSESGTLQEQLKTLDGEVSLASEKLEKFTAQEKKWKQRLEDITYQKSHIRALLRVKKKELNDLLNKKFVQEESFGSAQEVSILKWIFSSKSVGQILEEKRQASQLENQKKIQLQALEKLKTQLDENEQHAAILFHESSKLRDQITQEKQVLDQFTQAKANLIARLEYSQGQLEKEMDNYRRQQAEATVFLQNLRTALKQVEGKVGEVEVIPGSGILEPGIVKSNTLEFPLNISREITAEFHDEAYKKRFNREHIGVDFFAPQGTEIYAPKNAIVKKVAHNGYGYSYLILDHGKDLYTVYGHVSEILVNEGQKVDTGDLIGRTGGTPGTVGAGFFTTGPHLHWEVFENGKHQDPIKYLK